MKFSERVKLSNEYRDWLLKENRFEITFSPESFLAFLEIKGYKIINDKGKTKKEILLEELEKEDLSVLSISYIYAKNLHWYGIDITKTVNSAVENAAMMDEAYKKGYYDALKRQSEREEEPNEGNQIL